jgi:uncharacterized DUF497 family protein
MFDWDNVSGFQWDQGNARKSSDKHGVSQAEAEQIFFKQPMLIVRDIHHSQEEIRYHALGTTDDRRLLHVTFTLSDADSLIRVISARDMHRKERAIYEKAS